MTASTDHTSLTMLPATAQLSPRFDVAALQADLLRLDSTPWQLQRSYGETGLTEQAPADWRCLPLRSPGGDAHRTDPGGAGLDEFRDTRWLDDAPYLREVLATIPAGLRGVRLMRLAAGASVEEHCDSKCGFSYGAVRLHVPITTNPAATLTMAGRTHQWQPGTLWYADFRRPHAVRNDGEKSRVHLVIDSFVSGELLSLFPPAVSGTLQVDDVLFAADVVPLQPRELLAFCCRLTLPASFLCWSEEDVPSNDEQDVPAALDVREGRLVLHIKDKPLFALVHVGGGHFRFEGWTDERLLHVTTGPQLRVRLLTRNGRIRAEQVREAESGRV
jgi:Aspartyl/Asparaginyl beta-hydroxylase